MLQQTQVETVIRYFNRFITRFPDIGTLAKAREGTVMAHWSGLGYYRRARNLHLSARHIYKHFSGDIPSEIEDLLILPGIGISTAGAIRSLAFNMPGTILDGNVIRVLTRYLGIELNIKNSTNLKVIKERADQLLPKQSFDEYSQGMMDLGALICKKKSPQCDQCPISVKCHANTHHLQDRFPLSIAKNKIPTRSQVALLIKDKQSNSMLLKKRADGNVWPGLYAIPIFSDIPSVNEWLVSNTLAKLKVKQSTKTCLITFSHFKLSLTIYIVSVNSNKIKIAGPKFVWANKANINKIGVPQFIKKLIVEWQDD